MLWPVGLFGAHELGPHSGQKAVAPHRGSGWLASPGAAARLHAKIRCYFGHFDHSLRFDLQVPGPAGPLMTAKLRVNARDITSS